MNYIKNKLNNKLQSIIPFLNRRGFLNLLSDESYHKIMYWSYTGKKLNLNTPTGFSEKLHWLMINDHNPLYSILVDKYKVREYVRERIGDKYLVPIIDTYTSADEIDFNQLPNQFVLKCNHNSGEGMFVCLDKRNINVQIVKKNLDIALKHNYYYNAREWPYKDVNPLIICEQYIMGDYAINEKEVALLDYKFFCFCGEPKFLYLSLTDKPNPSKLECYDINFNRSPFQRTNHEGLPNQIDKPPMFDEMVEIAKKLSRDIPFVRVDLYLTNNKIYFSEMTLYPNAGNCYFYPEEWEYKIGEWLKLYNH